MTCPRREKWAFKVDFSHVLCFILPCRFRETLLHWLSFSFTFGESNSVLAYLPQLLPHIFSMQREADEDIAKQAMQIPALIAQATVPPKILEDILHATFKVFEILTGTFVLQLSRSYSKPEYSSIHWKWQDFGVYQQILISTRSKSTKSLLLFPKTFQTLRLRYSLFVRLMVTLYIGTRTRGIAFCSIVKSTNSNVPRLAQMFVEVIKVYNKKPHSAEAGIARHGAVLGLSALVATSPYEVAAWMPGLLVTLANYANDVLPVIKTTVKDTFAEFWRFFCSNFAS